MKTAVLDTNFILTCVKEKIDFIEKLQFMGFKLAVPLQVVEELEKLSRRKGGVGPRAVFALKMVNANDIKVIDIRTRKVDLGLIKYSKENEGVAIATIDLVLRRKIRGSKIVIRNKKSLEVL